MNPPPSRRPPLVLPMLVGLAATAAFLIAVLVDDPAPAPSGTGSYAQPVARNAVPRIDTAGERIAPAIELQQLQARTDGERRPVRAVLAAQRLRADLQNRIAAPRVMGRDTVAAPTAPAHNEQAPPAEPATTGTVSREAVQHAVKEVLPEVKRCYESALKMKDSRGKVKLSFTLVAADGGAHFESPEVVESDLANPVADACVLDAVARAKFPMPEQGNGRVRVTYPFIFRPDAE